MGLGMGRELELNILRDGVWDGMTSICQTMSPYTALSSVLRVTGCVLSAKCSPVCQVPGSPAPSLTPHQHCPQCPPTPPGRAHILLIACRHVSADDALRCRCRRPENRTVPLIDARGVPTFAPAPGHLPPPCSRLVWVDFHTDVGGRIFAAWLTTLTGDILLICSAV